MWKSGGETQKRPEPDASPCPFCKHHHLNISAVLLEGKKNNWRDAVMEIRNRIALYDLNKCFVQMPWLACGMRGEGSGVVVARGVLVGKRQHRRRSCTASLLLEMVFLHRESPNPLFK